MRAWCSKLNLEHTIYSSTFLDALIKRSADADQVVQDCGRIRFQRAMLAAVELYLETAKACPPGGQEASDGN
jgi:hypothetical protein